ncbi:MAG TPA: rod shape-determining protein MreC [Burkholderiales bacterium]|nr:rod shape-determining protein MreC [Burkholderiales bacterium]
MDHTPPPFFKRGPAPLVRLFFFASLSLALLVVDARFRYVEGLRSWLAIAAYPLQRLGSAPADIASRIGEYFSAQTRLVAENEALRAKSLTYAEEVQRLQALEAEAAHLRRLIGAAERIAARAQPAEVLYAGRDPYSHKVLIGRGAAQGVLPGSPIADERGLVGQVTRVHPLLSEVTLLTDRDHAVPVQVVRNGLRAVAFGGGASGMLELRFMSAVSDIQNGDRLVTSGIDGTYPAGLPVADVVRIERDVEQTFARAFARPVAGVDRGRYVLVLTSETALPPRPQDPVKERRGDRSRKAKADAAR